MKRGKGVSRALQSFHRPSGLFLDLEVQKKKKMKIVIKPVTSEAFSVEIDVEATVADLKEVASPSAGAEASRIKLVFRGHVLKDAEAVSAVGAFLCFSPPFFLLFLLRSSLFSHLDPFPSSSFEPKKTPGIQDGSIVHMVLTKAPPAEAATATAAPSAASPSAASAAAAAANPFSLPDPSSSAFSPSSMASNPLFQSMVSNPDLMMRMAEANPSLRALLDAGGPELRAALRDPNTLRAAAAAASDPAVAREAARSADRALAGMEAHPEGFQMLRRLQAQMQAAEAEAAGGEAAGGREGAGGAGAAVGTAVGAAGAPAGGPPNSDPLPNPWAPSPPSSGAGAGASGAGVAGAGAAGAGAPDLSSLLSMLGGGAGLGLGGAAAGAGAGGAAPPAGGDGLASLLSDPALLQTAAASDPRLRAMLESTPGMREALADPEFMRRTAALVSQFFGGGGAGGAAGAAVGGAPGVGGLPDFSQLAAMLGGGGGGAAGAAGGAAGAAGGMPDFAQLASLLGGAGGAGGGGLGALLSAGAGAGAAGDGAPFSMPPVADPETAFATQLSQLEGMGFSDRRRSIAALQATGGNVEAAVERLLQ